MCEKSHPQLVFVVVRTLHDCIIAFLQVCVHRFMFLLQNGIEVLVDGVPTTLYGGLIVTLADTLAAHELGGFKIGVGFALRKCRVCLVIQIFSARYNKCTYMYVHVYLHTACVHV